MLAKRLAHARKVAGLSLRELATKVGLSHAAIKKYEDGKVFPASDTLIKLSRVLKVRVEYFFRQPPMTLENIKYRKHSDVPKKTLDIIKHQIMDYAERRLELEAIVPTFCKSFIPIKSLSSRIQSFKDIEHIAEQIRTAWSLGQEPIADLVDVLENHGIRIFMVNHVGDAKFDGQSATINKEPIIIINSNNPGDRQRFTLAHELGHLILNDKMGGELDEEKACNRFAGAFLLPASAVRQDLGMPRTSLEIQELAILKEAFGLSMGSILRRAYEVGVINTASYKEIKRLFEQKGWVKKEPGVDLPSEKGHLLNKMVFHALAEDYIGESKAAELMNMTLQQFREVRFMEHDYAAVD